MRSEAPTKFQICAQIPYRLETRNYSPFKKQHFACHTSCDLRGIGKEGHLICVVHGAAGWGSVFNVRARNFAREYIMIAQM